MKSLFHRMAATLSVLVMFSGCFGPETPQETAAAFWEAVIENDAGGAVKYSTLENENAFDAFGQSWKGMKPTWKRVVIEENEASIDAEFGTPSAPGAERRKVTTYLVKRDGKWKVDYARTAEGMKGGIFAALVGELGRLGQQISDQLTASANDMKPQMEEMRRQMDALSASLDAQATEIIERYGEALRKNIDELSASAREALNAKGEQLSDKDRHVLDETADSLEADSDDLADPTPDNVVQGTENAAKAQQNLVSIDAESMEQYKQQWTEWKARFEKQAQQFLDDLNDALAHPRKGKNTEDSDGGKL